LAGILRRIFKRNEVKAPITDEKVACYVLITCKEPAEDGDMQVEMTCEGDENLIDYLISNVQEFFKSENNDNND